MTVKRLGGIMIILFGPVSGMAQNHVQGFVEDAVSAEPLYGVHIQAEGSAEGSISDEKGFFQISTHAQKVVFRHIGYDSLVLDLKESPMGSLTISLRPTRHLLDQVVVTGSKSEKRLKDLTISVERIPAQWITDKNPIQIDEMLDQVPGVQITDGQVNIRGGSGWSYGAGSRVMVLVDGVPLLTGDAGQALWSIVPTENIEAIEVVKGASSVLYGSSALNGIVNIRTKWPSLQPVTRISAFSGMYSKAPKSSWQWTDRRLITSGLRISDARRKGKHDVVSNLEILDDEGYRLGDFERRIRGGLNYRYKLSDNTFVGLRGHVFRGNSGSFLLWDSYDSAYTPLQGSNTLNVGTRFTLDPFMIHIDKREFRHALKLRFFHVQNRVDNGNAQNDQSNSSRLYYGEYLVSRNWPFKAIPRLELRSHAGATGNFAQTRSPLFDGVQQAGNAAAFMQFEPIYGPIKLELGFRYEFFMLNDYRERKPIGRAGMNITLSKTTFAHISFGQGFRFPTIAESYISTTVGPVSIYPNNRLRSETGSNSEIGITQGLALGKWLKGLAQLAAFDMRYHDMMEFTFGQWSNIRTPENNFGIGFKSINTGSVRIRGIEYSQELLFRLKRGELGWIGGVLYTDPISLEPDEIWGQDSVGNALSFTSTSSDPSSHTLKYRSKKLYRSDIRWKYKNLEAGMSLRYNSTFENIDAAFENQLMSILIPGIRESRLANHPGDLSADFRLFYAFHTGLRLGFLVNNAFNEERYVRPGDMASPRLAMIQLNFQVQELRKKPGSLR